MESKHFLAKLIRQTIGEIKANLYTFSNFVVLLMFKKEHSFIVSSIHRVLQYSLVSNGHVDSKLLTDYYWA